VYSYTNKDGKKLIMEEPLSGATASSPQCAYTIGEFCEAHRISRSQFYLMLKGGDGPMLMRVGRQSRISVEAAANWRRARELPPVRK
jgi:hypothetical protein